MTPEEASAAIKLLARVTLTGDEAFAYVRIKEALLREINQKKETPDD